MREVRVNPNSETKKWKLFHEIETVFIETNASKKKSKSSRQENRSFTVK